MDLVFETVSETRAGAKWQSLFQALWPAYQKWFLSDGIEARQTYLAGYRAFKKYMPELLPTYEHLCALAGGDDLSARFLSFYCPPAYLSGCSQAIWTGDEPMLVRNYDYAPALCDGMILHTRWNDRKVMGMSDGLFGLVDGINDRGLAISLTFGGRTIVGIGFGVPIILRYIMEFCDTTADAIEALKRIPCHMSYNVTVVDKFGKYATVYLTPDRKAQVTDHRVATNHQEHVEWHRHARATATVERERFLLQRLTLHNEPAERFISAFQQPPLYSTAFGRGFGTVYTAVYWPKRGLAEYRWPGVQWSQSLKSPNEGQRHIRFPMSGQALA
ncbi:MAG: C45 family peptidase [Rhodospirillales bacterium]